jgi:hypothetical protein
MKTRQSSLFKPLVVIAMVFGLFVLRVESSGYAATPMVKTESPSYYRLMLGDFEVTVLSDGTISEPVDTLLMNTTKDFVDTRLKENFAASPYEMSSNCFLINTGQKQFAERGPKEIAGSSINQDQRFVGADTTDANFQNAKIDRGQLTKEQWDVTAG